MKKMIIFAVAALVAGLVFADEYVTIKYNSSTGTNVIRGQSGATLIPVALYPEMYGTVTNATVCTFITGGVTCKLPSLPVIAGGLEVPIPLNNETTNTAPYAITADDQWKIVTTGTDPTSVWYNITFRLEK